MSTEPFAASTLGRTPDLLIGREAELAAIGARFAAEARLVSLVGPAGVGKTRIALEYAERVRAEEDVLVVTVSAGGISDRALLTDQLRAALPGPPGLAEGAVEALWERCHGVDVLLFLDGEEGDAVAGDLVEDLVTGYPRLRVLATGLRPLGARGEVVLRIQPFDLDAPGVPGEVPAPALIFAQRAVAGHAGFRLGPHNEDDVLSICRAVGGLPLAIELAASRCATIPVSVMAEQLTRPAGIELLHDGDGAGGRHASVERTLEWACAQLSDDEAALLDQLSVFEDAFDLEAALGVAMTPASDPAQLLDVISRLVDVHLVDLDPGEAGDPRFTLPRVVRSHARRRLARSGGEAAVRARHARHFRSRCQRPIDAAWLPDILVALDRSVIEGHVDDALHAAVAAAARTSGAGGVSVLQHRIDDMVMGAQASTGDPVLVALALMASATGDGHLVDGQTYAEWTRGRVSAAVDAARRSGDQHALLEALLLVVRSLPTTMDAPAAFAAAAEGLPLARDLADEPMTARFEMYAAMAAAVGGDVDTVAALGPVALARARAAGDAVTEIHTALLLHRVPPSLLAEELTLPTLEELLVRCEDLGESRLGGSVLAGLAERALDDDDPEAATRWAYRLQLVAADWRLTEPLAAVIPLVSLVVVAASRGDLREGIVLSASLEKFRSVLTFALAPEALARFEAASARLKHDADPEDARAWRQVGAALELAQANDLGLDYARSILVTLPPRAPARTPNRGPTELTHRETEVLVRLAAGATNKEIGADLGISAKTVMHHSVSIYRKLGVRGRGEATAWAFRAGLTEQR